LTRYAQSSSRANGFSARARSIAHTERARVVVTRNPQQDRARASAPGASLQFRDKRPAISAFIFPGLRTLSHGTSDPRLSEESLRTGGGQRRCSVSAAGLSIEAPTPKKGGQEVVLWCGLRNEFSSSGFLSNRTESTAERTLNTVQLYRDRVAEPPVCLRQEDHSPELGTAGNFV